MMNASRVRKYYSEICKKMRTPIYPIKFKYISKGCSNLIHDKKGNISHLEIDLSKCHDIELAILHEIAHQILILKNNNYSHNAAFMRMQDMLVDKYMYSQTSKHLYRNTCGTSK